MSKRVTIGWDGLPTIVLDSGHILPRRAEQIIHAKYYQAGAWPTDPETGEKLPIEPMRSTSWSPLRYICDTLTNFVK